MQTLKRSCRAEYTIPRSLTRRARAMMRLALAEMRAQRYRAALRWLDAAVQLARRAAAVELERVALAAADACKDMRETA